jgi:hypothetical protein
MFGKCKNVRHERQSAELGFSNTRKLTELVIHDPSFDPLNARTILLSEIQSIGNVIVKAVARAVAGVSGAAVSRVSRKAVNNVWWAAVLALTGCKVAGDLKNFGELDEKAARATEIVETVALSVASRVVTWAHTKVDKGILEAVKKGSV